MRIAIGSGIGFSSNSYNKGGGFDPDYQAVLDYMTSEGYTLPTATTQEYQNTLVADLKSAGVWSKLDSFSVFATDGDSDAALVDWKRLVTMTAVNAPTFTSLEGFTGDGVSAYIDTGYNPTTDGVNYTINDASVFWYKRERNTFSGVYISLSSFSSLVILNQAAVAQRINTLTSNMGLDLYYEGAGLVSKTSSLNWYFRKDLETPETGTVSTDALPNDNVRFFGYAAGGNFSDVQLSIVGLGADLSAESTDYYNAVQTYMTSIGKEV